jgi:hypothetical protein
MPFGPIAQAGSFIRFTYNSQASEDRFKEILVLNPNWRGEVHGIDLKRITPAERKVLEAIMDPKTKELNGRHPYPLVNDILRRMDPIEELKNPLSAYNKLIKPFIRNKDCYRKYKHHLIQGVQVMQKSAMEGAVTNPRPLFK